MTALGSWFARIYESPASASRIVPMEGVRGLAVLLVFFVHFQAGFGVWCPPGSLSAEVFTFLGHVGHSGVDLFFVLSGFLIYGAVISRNTPFTTFMARRIQRIYPPFLAMFAIYFALSFVFRAENKIPSGLGAGSLYLVENLLLLPGMLEITPMITVAWSLSFELFYYLLIPLVVAGGGLRSWRPESRVRFFLCAAVAYGAFCTLDIHPRLQLVMFVTGILLFETNRMRPPMPNPSPGRDLGGLAALAICFPVAALVMARSPLLDNLPVVGAHPWFLKVGVQFVGFYFFLARIFRSNGVLAHAFSLRPLRYLGNMSYSDYLVHGLALKFLALVGHRALPPAGGAVTIWLLLPVAFALTWVASTVLFVAVEKPFSLPAVRRPSP